MRQPLYYSPEFSKQIQSTYNVNNTIQTTKIPECKGSLQNSKQTCVMRDKFINISSKYNKGNSNLASIYISKNLHKNNSKIKSTQVSPHTIYDRIDLKHKLLDRRHKHDAVNMTMYMKRVRPVYNVKRASESDRKSVV